MSSHGYLRFFSEWTKSTHCSRAILEHMVHYALRTGFMDPPSKHASHHDLDTYLSQRPYRGAAQNASFVMLRDCKPGLPVALRAHHRNNCSWASDVAWPWLADIIHPRDARRPTSPSTLGYRPHTKLKNSLLSAVPASPPRVPASAPSSHSGL